MSGEPGGELVRDLLAGPDRDVPVYAHAVNLFEVFHLFLRAAGAVTVEDTIRQLKAADVEERADLDGAFWRDAVALVASQRGQGRYLAQGDAFGLALARRESADFYNTDRHEIEAIARDGLASVVFIR